MTTTIELEIELDLYELAPTAVLTTPQVGNLKGRPFGKEATLEHNRSVGRPSPKYIKIAGRVFYRVSDLLDYLTVQEAESDRRFEARRAQFEANTRRGFAHMAALTSSAGVRAAADTADRIGRSSTARQASEIGARVRRAI